MQGGGGRAEGLTLSPPPPPDCVEFIASNSNNSNIKIQTFLPDVQRNIKVSRAFTMHDDILNYWVACVAEWLTPWTPDLEVRGSGLPSRVVSLDK